LKERRESVEKRVGTHPTGPTKALSRLSDNNESKPAPALGPAVMKTIGHELQAMYADIIAEGVPERFAAILRKLDDPSNDGETR
jgi:hypothetical protein